MTQNNTAPEFKILFLQSIQRVTKLAQSLLYFPQYLNGQELSTAIMNKFLKQLVILLITVGLPSHALANLIIEEYASDTPTPTLLGGYAMTDFNFLNVTSQSDLFSSIDSPISGTLDFLDNNGDSLGMAPSTANTIDWWVNGEEFDYDIYRTDEHVVTLILPEDTLAFSFNVGASVTGTYDNAWLTATALNGSGIEDDYWFNVNNANTPGFGIYTDNKDSCSTISSITIDPYLWGFGNFSISQGNCATTVPEPSILALLSFGLFGLGFAGRLNRVKS